MTKGRKRRIVENLFGKQGGRCHWCGCETELPPAHRATLMQPSMATLDHLFDKFHPRRRQYIVGERRYVLACYQCNIDRSAAAIAAADELTMMERAARPPRSDRAGRAAYFAVAAAVDPSMQHRFIHSRELSCD